MERKYRHPKGRNKGFRRPSDAATSASQTDGGHPCGTKSEAIAHNAVSPAISVVDPLSNSIQEKLTIENAGDTIHKSTDQSGGQPSKPDCYKCAYRGGIPGSAHSKCLAAITENCALSSLVSMLAGGRAGNITDSRTNPQGVTGNEHGKRSGWFNWPFNFDPVWLETCNAFKEK